MPGQELLSDSEASDDGAWSDGGQDEDEEGESTIVISLLDDRVFPDALSMIHYCNEKYGLDFLGIRDRLGLDFYGSVKLINFIRHKVHEGMPLPDEIIGTDIQDDRYLKPVLEDDSLILCLDDLPAPAHMAAVTTAVGDEARGGSNVDRVKSLLQEKTELEAELDFVTKQFANYRLAVQKTLDRRWGNDDEPVGVVTSGSPATSTGNAKVPEVREDDSEYYFSSYAHNDIHETMLKDTVRTDAYRDFIYGNKHLFAGKVVLDVGCGTGILAMFCAKAGARRVIAVDNSDIVDKARENVFRNGLDSCIDCLRGKIEEVTLPVEKVDVIVSEWMGYCLLYEAMLPSIIWARDRYLQPDGLLVPSHASIWIAPVADPDYVAENVAFWRDVYGFDMQAMQKDMHREARVEVMPASSVCGTPSAFRFLDLHSVQVSSLVFDAAWEVTLSRDIDRLDGFLVWFDIFFQSRAVGPPPIASTVPERPSSGTYPERVSFTTGPFGPATHWKQGLLLSEEAHDDRDSTLVAGTRVRGEIAYRIPDNHARGLTLKVTWETGTKPKQSQTWLLR